MYFAGVVNVMETVHVLMKQQGDIGDKLKIRTECVDLILGQCRSHELMWGDPGVW